MKRKILIILLSIMSVVCLALGLSACNGNNSNTEHVHSMTHYSAVDATETTDGNTEYWYCSGCGKYFSDSNGKTEISQSETVIPATGTTTEGGSTEGGGTEGGSTEGGSTEGGSTEGGSTEGGSTEGGSTEGGGTEGGSTEGGSTEGGSTEGGSTEGGSTEGGSTEGGSTEGSSTEENPSAHTHTLVYTEKVEATCVKEGNTEYWYCSDCKKYFSDESGATEISLADTVIEKLAHTVVVDSVVAATCTSTGLTEGSHCSVCNTVIVAQEVTEKLEHTVVTDEAVAATCTSTGLTEGSHCSVCNTVIIAQEITEKLAHTVVVDSAVVATCTSTGLTEGSHCSVCNTVIVAQEVTEKLEHTYNGYSYDDNEHWQVCIVCENQTEAEDHTYGSDNTCTVCGYKKLVDSEGLEYTLSDDKTYYTVSGIGECTDTDIVIPSTYEGLPVEAIGLYAFRGCTSITSVTIPNSVTSFSYGAFSGCTSLTSVTIPNSVTSILSGAFSGCTSLKSITLPDSITSISNEMFMNCTSLESITIPGGVTAVVSYAFYGCTSLKSVIIPDGVTSIGECAFDSCTSLENITLPDSVTFVDMAFSDCTSLTNIAVGSGNTVFKSIDGNLYSYDGNELIQYAVGKTDTSFTIPDSVTSIGYNAFGGSKSLKSITIPDSVTSIGYNAFYGCTSLTSIIIPDGITSINEAVFKGCTSLKSVTIPDSVIIIDYGAFSGCSSLTNIAIPDTVTDIGNTAFKDCTLLTSVTIPDSVMSIGGSAFYGCTSLISVIIGNSVTSISFGAFYSCDSLTSVYYNGTLEEWSAITIGDSNTSLTNATIYYYSETQPYNNGNYWHYVNGEVVVWEIAEHTEHTYDGYSYDSNGHWQVCTVCENQTEVEAHSYGSDNICTICGYENVTASEGSEGLAYTLSDDETYYIVSGIGTCTNTDIVIPSTYNGLPVTSIGESAFSNCTSLKSVTIGKGVTSTGYKAFYGCTSLKSVTISNGVTSIGGSTFYDCTSLESVTIPNSVTLIGNSAFRNCSSLTSVAIGSGVTTISTGAFYGCTSLTSVTLPSSVTSIGSSVFLLCISLTSITIPDSVTSIGDYAFGYCDSLTSITIPDSVTSIGERAFHYCTSLASIVIPDSVTSIGDYAFFECSSFTSVYFNGTEEEWNVITIGDYNTSLTSATRYYYSETQPTDSGNYWHYVNGVITIWVQGATDAAYVGNSYTIDYTTLTYYIDDVESEEAKEDFASMLGSVANYTLTFTDSKDFTCVYYSYTRDTYYTATGNYSLDNESNIFIFSNCSWTDESDSDTMGDATTFLNDGWAVFGYDGTDVTVLVYIERNQPVYSASGVMQLVNNVSVVGNTYELTDIEYTFSDSVTEERQESVKTSYSQTIGMTMAFNSDGTASFTYPEAVDDMNTTVAYMTITYVVNNDNTITITSVYDSDVSIITVKIIDSETLSQELDMLEGSAYSMTYIYTLVTE